MKCLHMLFVRYLHIAHFDFLDIINEIIILKKMFI